MNIKSLLEAAIEIARLGGEHTLKYFKKDFDVISKEDDSPVTIADRETEQLMRAEIQNGFLITESSVRNSVKQMKKAKFNGF